MTTPSALLPYQQAWVGCDAPVAFWEKSRRIGASWCDACAAVLTASEAGGQDALYIGYSEDMTREYIDDCAMWAKSFAFAANAVEEFLYVDEDGEKSIKAFRIDFASGHKVLALSSRPRSIRGKQGRVTIDEAGFHDDLDGLLKAALAMLVWGGQVRVISSHNGADNLFNQIIVDSRSGKLPYQVFKTTFDDALRDGLYRRRCLIKGEPWTPQGEHRWRESIVAFYGDHVDEELFVIPAAGTGVYLPRMLVERCGDPEIPVLRFGQPPEYVLDPGRLEKAARWFVDTVQPVLDNLPADRRHVLGQDFGRDGDLSVIWVLTDLGGGRWRTGLVLELRKIPFDVQQQLLFALVDALPLFHHAKFDARGNGQSHAEAALQRYGVARVECVMLTLQWYAEHFPPYKRAYEDQQLAVPASEDIIADHRRVILDKGRPKVDDKHDKGSDGKPRHGDSAVAGVLAWAAAREEGEPAFGETVDSTIDWETESGGGRPRCRLFGRSGMQGWR